MNGFIKKLTVYALLFGMQAPVLAYKWTIYNALGVSALVRLNVSGQKQRAVIPAGEHFVFNYNKKGGWHNSLAMNGLCLTSIHAMLMGENKEYEASLRAVKEDAIKGMLSTAGVSSIFLINPANAAVAFVIGSIITVSIILSKLCKSGKWVIARDKKNKMYAITVR